MPKIARFGCALVELNHQIRIDNESWEWAKLGVQAAIFVTVSLPSRTAALVMATRCAPCGDHRMRRRLPMRVFPMVLSDECELVSARTMKPPVMPHRVDATQQERRFG
ncbi:hypothetical protein IMCC1933_18050 [Rhodobacteraceae bacterium IMCC1933]|nr:hypothetical protein [Rhodobacteraceae bacterium IMCC1923]MDP4068253.1 hypothetical protein [Rhodobacteraceae bacterium IMCC1933]MDP4071519.1 hypothetical protein [Rhodobacteraceae bacterium IMCC1909]